MVNLCLSNYISIIVSNIDYKSYTYINCSLKVKAGLHDISKYAAVT